MLARITRIVRIPSGPNPRNAAANRSSVGWLVDPSCAVASFISRLISNDTSQIAALFRFTWCLICMIPMLRRTAEWLIISISVTCGCGSHTASRQQSNQPGVDKDTKVVASDRPTQYARNCDFSERHPLRISDWLSHGGIVKRVEPSYPPEAERRRLHGRSAE